jgi:hypothetical protein
MYFILIAITIFISVSLSGLFAPAFPKNVDNPAAQDEYTCCETGSGEKCRAIPEASFDYYNKNTKKTDRYDLIKRDAFLANTGRFLMEEHMDPAVDDKGKNILTPDKNPIFVNRGESRKNDIYPECVGRGKDNTGYDRLYGKPDPRNTKKDDVGKGCYAIPDELLLYVCRKDSPGNCFNNEAHASEVKFDIYIRRGEAIPEPIKNCYKPPLPASGQKMIVFKPSPEGQKNLQLRTFKFTQEKPPVFWMSPYCKPAIYLYPERKTEMNVSVFPQGEMLLTIPPYPKNGWNVVAEPNGDIHYQNNRFDYLYYEASIPDQLIQKPDTGYVIPYDERSLFLTDLVTKLGLNEKETQQFVEYWVPILPKSPYYFIGVVPESTLHEISPVLITTKPDNLIRVTLYFQALDKKVTVTPPLILPVSRDGFTAVEWGGIYKQDKDHPFSCFM